MGTRQIAVRLPEDVAAFVDAEVAAGRAASRAAVVTQALRRDQRRRAALADIEILKHAADATDVDDLDVLSAHVAHRPLDLD
jgi:Arc/MetJ-type ribon-helix-helix transcriptional regulator